MRGERANSLGCTNGDALRGDRSPAPTSLLDPTALPLTLVVVGEDASATAGVLGLLPGNEIVFARTPIKFVDPSRVILLSEVSVRDLEIEGDSEPYRP